MSSLTMLLKQNFSSSSSWSKDFTFKEINGVKKANRGLNWKRLGQGRYPPKVIQTTHRHRAVRNQRAGKWPEICLGEFCGYRHDLSACESWWNVWQWLTTQLKKGRRRHTRPIINQRLCPPTDWSWCPGWQRPILIVGAPVPSVGWSQRSIYTLPHPICSPPGELQRYVEDAVQRAGPGHVARPPETTTSVDVFTAVDNPPPTSTSAVVMTTPAATTRSCCNDRFGCNDRSDRYPTDIYGIIPHGWWVMTTQILCIHYLNCTQYFNWAEEPA